MKISVLWIFLIFPIEPLSARANQIKICEIIYGKTGLDQKISTNKAGQRSTNNSFEKCSQIGLEHNSNLEPLSNKPIYACCKP